jgi:DNA invertase Pin-like site-specific DNA recombinase
VLELRAESPGQRHKIRFLLYFSALPFQVVDYRCRNLDAKPSSCYFIYGAKTIIVESPDRFARDLAVQLAGHDMLKELGIAIIPASAPDFFTEDTPTAILVRQVLGAIAQFEKASAVAKLASARKRKREREGRCEGRKPLSETRPEVVAIARKLRRRRPKGGQLSLREVSRELATLGFLNERGKPYAAKSVASMLN